MAFCRWLARAHLAALEGGVVLVRRLTAAAVGVRLAFSPHFEAPWRRAEGSSRPQAEEEDEGLQGNHEAKATDESESTRACRCTVCATMGAVILFILFPCRVKFFSLDFALLQVLLRYELEPFYL